MRNCGCCAFVSRESWPLALYWRKMEYRESKINFFFARNDYAYIEKLRSFVILGIYRKPLTISSERWKEKKNTCREDVAANENKTLNTRIGIRLNLLFANASTLRVIVLLTWHRDTPFACSRYHFIHISHDFGYFWPLNRRTERLIKIHQLNEDPIAPLFWF